MQIAEQHHLISPTYNKFTDFGIQYLSYETRSRFQLFPNENKYVIFNIYSSRIFFFLGIYVGSRTTFFLTTFKEISWGVNHI